MNSGIIIRAAVPLDCSNIARLIRASWELSQAVQAVQVSDQRTVEFIAESMKEAVVVVAELAGRIIGALACAPMRERWGQLDDWLLCDEFFVVVPNWVARGIPERLLTDVEKYADEQRLPLVMGGSLMTSFALEPLLDRRPGYSRVIAQWLRMPRANDDEPQTPEPMQQSSEA